MTQDPHHGPPGGQPPSGGQPPPGWGQQPPHPPVPVSQGPVPVSPQGELGPADLVGRQGLNNPHHQPHAASAGPSDGARGAMWFAVAMAVLVVVCLIGILVIVAS